MRPKHSSSPRMSVLSTNGPVKPQGYPDLLAEIKQRIRSAQYATLKAANQKVVGLYRGIGRMKASFEAHIDLEKLAPLVREIDWSHNLVILERCKDPLQLRLVQERADPSNRKPELPKISAGAAMKRRKR